MPFPQYRGRGILFFSMCLISGLSCLIQLVGSTEIVDQTGRKKQLIQAK